MKQKKFILPESEMPDKWYNIQADMVNKPLPILNPKTREPLKAEDLFPIFCEECSRQEMNQTDAWIEIPEAVREKYANYRCTPLVRAYGLEETLDTPAHIYFKNESVSPVGSHKLNSALAQAYYCKQQGITNITTETGAGQWGAALSYASKVFGLDCAVYQVKISYEQKPYRRSIMQVFGAQVTPSPSMSTRAGKDILTVQPNHQGSLGTAISEAIELAMTTPNCRYTLGSVLNHVSLHQTIIGLEAEKQMEMAGEYILILSLHASEAALTSAVSPILLCVIPSRKAKKSNLSLPNLLHVPSLPKVSLHTISVMKQVIHLCCPCLLWDTSSSLPISTQAVFVIMVLAPLFHN